MNAWIETDFDFIVNSKCEPALPEAEIGRAGRRLARAILRVTLSASPVTGCQSLSPEADGGTSAPQKGGAEQR